MMVTLILEAVSPSLRGTISKWMIEPRAGVFVGTLSATVREELWKRVCAESGAGRCVMIYSAANEQGFAIRSWGDSERVIDVREGLYLVRRLPRVDDDIMRSADDVMRLWAKSDPFQPLVCHMVDVGHVALALLKTDAYRSVLDRWIRATGCPPEAAQSWIAFLAALHDWGKAWPNFQCRLVDGVHPSIYEADFVLPGLEKIDDRLRHEKITAQWALHFLTELGWNRASARTVAGALALHHSQIEGSDVVALSDFPTKQRWLELKDEVRDLLFRAFSPPDWKAGFHDHSAAGLLLLGLTVWADWIASNAELFPLRWQGEEWADYNALSAIAAERAVAKLGLGRGSQRKAFASFGEMWPEFEGYSPVQQAVEELANSETDLGLVIIEAPMGEGKSEAAFYLASRLMEGGAGLYVALPTAATSNQMFRRVQDFLARMYPGRDLNVQLIHGMSWLVDQASPQRAPDVGTGEADRYHAFEWFLPRKRSLLSPFGVGTIDQALMAALHIKFGFLRLFGLAGKVLIVDEVHACDAYMSEMLVHLLRWCRSLDITVILLSATLPQRRSDRLIAEYLGENRQTEVDERGSSVLPYPLITAVSKSGRVVRKRVAGQGRERRVRVVPHYGLLNDPDGTADLAVKLAGEQGCICVVANTVASAQQIYQSLRSRYPEVEALLFHARFLAKDRQRIEETVVKLFGKASLKEPTEQGWHPRPKRMILVATQVVEQSLDLDFDLMISEIAPIDLLLQRIGRLHRHQRPGRPISAEEIHVLLPAGGSFEFGATERVYGRYLLMGTCKVLNETWSLPDDFRRLIESVYGDLDLDLLDAQQGEWESAEAQMQREIDRQEREAKKYLIPDPAQNAFKLARMVEREHDEVAFFDENDADVSGYVHAKTRYGDDSMRVAMVDAAVWEPLSRLKSPPSREVLEELLLYTVNVPRHWFSEVTKKEPYPDLQPAPRWLHVEMVVPLLGNRWEGRRGPEEVVVEVDDVLGVRKIEKGEWAG